jgi:starch phosphorylase
MMQDYLNRYYLPGAAAYRERTAPPEAEVPPTGVAADLELWRAQLDEHWGEITFLDYSVETRDDTHLFRVNLSLGSIPPGAVVVELYAEPVAGGTPERYALMTDPDTLGTGAATTAGTYTFQAMLPAARPASDFTPRVIPWHASARIPLEAGHILWYR